MGWFTWKKKIYSKENIKKWHINQFWEPSTKLISNYSADSISQFLTPFQSPKSSPYVPLVRFLLAMNSKHNILEAPGKSLQTLAIILLWLQKVLFRFLKEELRNFSDFSRDLFCNTFRYFSWNPLKNSSGDSFRLFLKNRPEILKEILAEYTLEN